MTNRYVPGLILVIALSALVSAVHAAPVITSSLTTQDYFNIFLAAIVLVNVFVVAVIKLLHRESTGKEFSKFANVAGTIVAFLLVAVGSMVFIFDALVLVSITSRVSSFLSAYYLFTYLWGETTAVSIIITGASGLLIFLIGLYIIIVLHGSGRYDTTGMPSSSGYSAREALLEEDIEPLNPTIRLKVVAKESGTPAPDVKVVLKQRDGIKFHSKFTDFNGEVTFNNVEGYSLDYYPYVEGDEKKEIFRVIQV